MHPQAQQPASKSIQKTSRPLAEEVVNALTHGIGALVSVSAITLLITFAAMQEDVWKIVGASIYGGSLFLLLLASTLYHGIQYPRAKFVLKLFDHCAIYLLIAGTYTPFLLVSLRGTLGWTLFSILWGLALVGVFMKLAFPGRFKWMHLLTYVGMGWVGAVAIPEMMEKLADSTFTLIVAGGIVYTVGVIFYVMERIPFSHSIWHLFVLGGSTCHFIAVYTDIVN